MSSNINMVLAECERQTQQLIKEISKYRTAAAISDQSAKSLDSLCKALEATQRKIEPFIKQYTKRVLIGLFVLLWTNTLLLAVITFLLLKNH